MPARRKGSDLARRTTKSTIMRDRRAKRRDVQIQPNNENVRVNMVWLCEAQAEQNQNRRLEARQLKRMSKIPFKILINYKDI